MEQYPINLRILSFDYKRNRKKKEDKRKIMNNDNLFFILNLNFELSISFYKLNLLKLNEAIS